MRFLLLLREGEKRISCTKICRIAKLISVLLYVTNNATSCCNSYLLFLIRRMTYSTNDLLVEPRL